ncbi:MAG: hypothetical protein K0R26_2720 [Bacteroidota bacterium]|jgi:hypothetical protein|nr:hypothetical protein [Bacteroidota bacterium]
MATNPVITQQIITPEDKMILKMMSDLKMMILKTRSHQIRTSEIQVATVLHIIMMVIAVISIPVTTVMDIITREEWKMKMILKIRTMNTIWIVKTMILKTIIHHETIQE